ncbi:MAG: DUF167 domain-containing protein [Planctomycetota bacterium]|jgi:uncharacterized protein (TIGR00251 family)
MKNAENIALRTTDDGVIVPVKVVAGSSRDTVVGVLGDCLKITTAAAAEKHKANAAVAGTLAKTLGVGPRNVQLIAGQTNPRKEFLIAGLTEKLCRQRLVAL